MATGRDLAKFISQQLGQDFVGLYDESEKEEKRMMEQKEKFSKGFSSMIKRVNTVESKNRKDTID